MMFRRKLDIWRKYSGRNINFTKWMSAGVAREAQRGFCGSPDERLGVLGWMCPCHAESQYLVGDLGHSGWERRRLSSVVSWGSPWLPLNVGSRLTVEEKWGHYFLYSQQHRLTV